MNAYLKIARTHIDFLILCCLFAEKNMSNKILSSELIINEDGSIYHLGLKPDEIADTIITVGDPNRVLSVSQYFDSIELKKSNREFVTHTGYIGNKRLTCISTGIGTDNIDIVINELDALKNIDFESRTIKENPTSLSLIRIGTSGAIQPDIPIDSYLVSEFAIGLDGLMGYYNYIYQNNKWQDILHPAIKDFGILPYFSKSDNELLQKIGDGFLKGITITNTGFYGPQGRNVRASVKNKDYIDTLVSIDFEGRKITNLEMETAGIYALSSMLGHQAISLNAILANRSLGVFSQQANKTVDTLIRQVLEKLV